jgi:hypothetical protein
VEFVTKEALGQVETGQQDLGPDPKGWYERRKECGLHAHQQKQILQDRSGAYLFVIELVV